MRLTNIASQQRTLTTHTHHHAPTNQYRSSHPAYTPDPARMSLDDELAFYAAKLEAAKVAKAKAEEEGARKKKEEEEAAAKATANTTDYRNGQQHHMNQTYSTHSTTSGYDGHSSLDKIILKEMTFFGRHGCYPHENANGQPFEVDLEMEVDLTAAGESDHLNDTIDYGRVHAVCKEIVEGKPRNLLEKLALTIIDRILNDFPVVHTVKVQIRKPKVGLSGVLKSAGVEMWRARGVPPEPDHQPLVDDSIVYDQEPSIAPLPPPPPFNSTAATHINSRDPSTLADEEDDILNGKVKAGVFRRPKSSPTNTNEPTTKTDNKASHPRSPKSSPKSATKPSSTHAPPIVDEKWTQTSASFRSKYQPDPLPQKKNEPKAPDSFYSPKKKKAETNAKQPDTNSKKVDITPTNPPAPDHDLGFL